MRQKKKEWGAIQIVTTRKEHECECCDRPVAKGTKALVNSGFTFADGYFRLYFHLDDNGCYGTFMDACGIHPEAEDGKLIMNAVKALSQSSVTDDSSKEREKHN